MKKGFLWFVTGVVATSLYNKFGAKYAQPYIEKGKEWATKQYENVKSHCCKKNVADAPVEEE